MTNLTTAQTVTRIIAAELNLHPANLTADSVLLDLGADSLDLASMVFEIETALDLEETDTQALHNVRTVGDLIKLVEGMVPA